MENQRPEVAFGKRVRLAREAAKMSQTELATELAGKGFPMHQSTIAKLELAQRPIRLDETFAIAQVFGVSLASLIGDDEVVFAHVPPDLAELRALREQLRKVLA